MLKRYWLVICPAMWNGPKNLGVTAISIDQAKSLAIVELDKLGWKQLPYFEINHAEFIEDVDIRELDQNHVIPNIGVVSKQGVWFPNCNS
jgi:hypothetical protein